MEVEFEDKNLALVETDKAAETRLPFSVIKSCRKKLEVIRAAPDERTLRNWKSLHYEKLKGRKTDEEKSIRLNDQWRLVFRINTGCNPPKMIILSIEDYH